MITSGVLEGVTKYDHAIREWSLICGMVKKLNSMARRKVVPITGQNIMIVIDLIF